MTSKSEWHEINEMMDRMSFFRKINTVKIKNLKKMFNKKDEEIIDDSGNEKLKNTDTGEKIENAEIIDGTEALDAMAVQKLESELLEINDKFLRLYSDFENYKKRILKERIELTKSAGIEIILSMLPIVDDLERALKMGSNEKETNSAFKDGIQLICSKFKIILQQKGLQEIENASGKEFDTDLHDAITNIPAPSDDLKGKVIEEVEKGYTLHGKVIRHSKVVVGNLE